MVATVVSTGMALMVGWVAGMWTHRRAERWCPVDGSKLTCPECRRTSLEPSPVDGPQ